MVILKSQYCQHCCKICLFHKISDLQIIFYGTTAASGARLPYYLGFTITLGRVISPTQRPVPNNTQHSQETSIHASGGIRTRNPSMRPTADPCLRQRVTGIGNLQIMLLFIVSSHSVRNRWWGDWLVIISKRLERKFLWLNWGTVLPFSCRDRAKLR